MIIWKSKNYRQEKYNTHLRFDGVGKSTFAKALAKELNYRFIDIEDVYFSKQDNPNYLYENPVLIYEDNVAGRLDDERFAMMSKNYTQEQKDYTSAMTS